MKKKIPIWLADDPNSGVFVYWATLLMDLPLDEIVFVSDSPDINPGLAKYFITSEELIRNRQDYYLPIMNLGVSQYYTKQIQYLYNFGGFLFFHQLYLHRLMETYFTRGQAPSERALENYGRHEGGRVTELLARLGARNGLHNDEYYLRTFAVQLAERSIGFCSSWTGCSDRLQEEGLGDDAASRFFYLPPVYDVMDGLPEEPATRADFSRRPLRLGILGHKTPMKNAAFCLELVKEMNAQGVPTKLVAIGSIGDLVKEACESPGDAMYFEQHTADQHQRFLQLLDTLDLNMHFRHPFGGEMSLTICETMARGVPSMGYEMDWFLDLPEDSSVPIPFGVTTEEAARAAVAAVGTPEKMHALKSRLHKRLHADTSKADALVAIEKIFDHVRAHSDMTPARP